MGVVVQAHQATWLVGRYIRETYAGVDFIPQSQIYEFGFCSFLKALLLLSFSVLSVVSLNLSLKMSVRMSV
jgi:hypothetical protein